MALPTAYLTSFKNVDAVLAAIRAAQAPPRFTQRFLEGLGFPNTNDRLFINVLKALKFLDDAGIPTRRYHQYLDQTQSERILAEGIRDAYADLFQINSSAQEMSASEVKNKMKTLSEGQFTDRVLTQMSGTFKALSKGADFTSSQRPARVAADEPTKKQTDSAKQIEEIAKSDRLRVGGLVYSINIVLPESRDSAVCDALFKSLKEHLLE